MEVWYRPLDAEHRIAGGVHRPVALVRCLRVITIWRLLQVVRHSPVLERPLCLLRILLFQELPDASGITTTIITIIVIIMIIGVIFSIFRVICCNLLVIWLRDEMRSVLDIDDCEAVFQEVVDLLAGHRCDPPDECLVVVIFSQENDQRPAE